MRYRVRAVGLEPTRSFEHGHLKPARIANFATPAAWPSYPLAHPVCRWWFLRWRHPAKGATMRSADEFNEVRQLIAAGMNDCAIARLTGIPRPTVRDWRCRPHVRTRLPDGSTACGVDHDFPALPAAPYCYLLGLYLGDGCISRIRRVWRLRVVLDAKYPAIIERCRQAIDMLMPGQRARAMQLPKNCVEVSLYSKHWPCLFPQHGPGKKHTRTDRARTVAASARRPGDRRVRPWTHPQ